MHKLNAKTLAILFALAIVPTGCFDPLVTEETQETNATDETTTSGSADSDTAESTTAVEPDSSSGAPEPVCGNGVVEGTEACDDGVNDGSYGGCNADCTAPGPFCGDGVVNGEEPCDDGDDVDGNGCNVDCVVSGTVLWTVTYDGPDSGIDGAFGASVDSEGNVFVVGTIDVNEQNTAWTRKHTPNGAAIWTELYPSNYGDSSASSVITLANGDIVFGGSFDSANTETIPDAWLNRVSSQGAQAWTQTYASPQGWYDGIQDLDTDADGYIYALFDSANHGFVRKYDQEGNELWTIFIDDIVNPWSLATDEEGGTVVVGTDQSGSDFAPYITKLNSDGGTEWTQVLETYDNAYFTTVDVDSAGNVAAGLVSVDSDERLLLFDPSGAPSGELYPHAGESSMIIDSIALLDNSHLFAAGMKGSDGHLWVTRYSDEGSELWTFTYNGEDWGYGFDSVTELAVDSDGNVIAVGVIQETDATLQDIWVTKFAP